MNIQLETILWFIAFAGIIVSSLFIIILSMRKYLSHQWFLIISVITLLALSVVPYRFLGKTKYDIQVMKPSLSDEESDYNYEEDEVDKYDENNDINKVRLTGYVDTREFALEKTTLESMTFSRGDDDLWMYLDNYSEQPIIITGAYIKVINYKPLEPDGYVLFRKGDGDTFDQILGLYAKVDSAPGQYPAVQVDVDEYGSIDYDSLYEDGGDSVPHIGIISSNGKNILCEVVFSDPGIYTYQLCIQYLYNNEEQEVESGEITSLYDNDSDSIERADEEFYENEEYYMEYI